MPRVRRFRAARKETDGVRFVDAIGVATAGLRAAPVFYRLLGLEFPEGA
ncbi:MULTISPECIES: hypothetical protein [unclassified Streptomyces]|nr:MULTISPECIES: hypothetical protein [unclassified Streptomyces]